MDDIFPGHNRPRKGYDTSFYQACICERQLRRVCDLAMSTISILYMFLATVELLNLEFER